MCYHRSWLFPSVITFIEVPAISKCDNEFLPIFFHKISLLLIMCYHSFWNNFEQYELAIYSITDIMAVHKSCASSLREMLVRDFNGLCKYYETISSLTVLKACVSFPTRGAKTLHQIFSNCDAEYLPASL